MTQYHDRQAWESARALCDAGVLRGVRRAGSAPIGDAAQLDLELDFDGPGGLRTFRVMTGPVGASDISVAEGAALELFAGHLREEDPACYAEIAANWHLNTEDEMQWALGAQLSRPFRLEMTRPYIETVGFVFDCERDGRMIGRAMIFASADILFAVRENHPEVGSYGLRERGDA